MLGKQMEERRRNCVHLSGENAQSSKEEGALFRIRSVRNVHFRFQGSWCFEGAFAQQKGAIMDMIDSFQANFLSFEGNRKSENKEYIKLIFVTGVLGSHEP